MGAWPVAILVYPTLTAQADVTLDGPRPTAHGPRPTARRAPGTGAVFAAYLTTMLPMFLLVGFSMRYFVAGMTEGALKL